MGGIKMNIKEKENRLEQLKKEIRQENEKKNYSDEVVQKILEYTTIAREISKQY